MNETSCPGLDGSNPLHFLACVGALRLLPVGSTLSWRYSGAWIPAFETNVPVVSQMLSCAIRKAVPDHPPILAAKRRDGSIDKTAPDQADRALIESQYKFLLYGDGVARAKPSAFRRAGGNAMGIAEPSLMNPSHPAWLLSALSAESAPDKDGNLEATALSFSNGGGMQFLLKDFITLASLCSPEAVAWTLSGDPCRFLWCTSLNWDPTSLRSYAHQWTEPESSPKLTDVACNALAFFGLGSLPVVPRFGGNSTVGFDDTTRSFRWMLWEGNLEIDTVASLLASSPCAPSKLREWGAVAVYESHRVSSNKRLYFMPSKAV